MEENMVSVIAAVLVIHYSDSAMPADLDSPDPQWIASCDCDWEGTAANHGAAEALHAAHQAAAVLAAITAESLTDTRQGLALANQAWREGAATMLQVCNDLFPGDIWEKPVSPYSAPLLRMIKAEGQDS